MKGFREGQILMWNALGFDILKAIGVQLPNAPNVYQSFMYPLKPNCKWIKKILEGQTS
jgi:hypothetical protein